MTPPDLMTLAEKCEKAGSFNRSLDLVIHHAINFPDEPHEYETWWMGSDDVLWRSGVTRNVRDWPWYTRSIDAAIALVPDGMTWNVTSNGAAIVGQYGGTPVHCIGSWDGWNKERPALALCAAALRARAAQGD